MIKGLYVNHRKQKCGVYEFGKEIANLLLASKKYNFKYCECDSLNELKKICKSFKPEFIIYNYTPITMGWINVRKKFQAPISYQIPAIHVGTIHEVYQKSADEADNSIFDFHIAPDPTLLLKNPLVYKTGRLLLKKAEFVQNNSSIPIVGSFGFATPGKGFEKIISLVQNEFEQAVIRLNIPFAQYGDADGANAKQLVEECKKLIHKKSIQLHVSHDYLSKAELLSFLSSNSINVFLYDDDRNRGISSVTDWALAAGRPLAISQSNLFRHLFHCNPSICIENSDLKTIIANGIDPIKHLWDEYSPEIILWEYERIISDILIKKSKSSISKRTITRYYLKRLLNKAGLFKQTAVQNNSWTKTSDSFSVTGLTKAAHYDPVELPVVTTLNRILDNTARREYSPAIHFLEENFPELISKKIAEANVQQAFVMDTAIRLSANINNPKILAVGSFEDTAVEALKILNYQIDDIDPILNYDLHTYTTKPNIKPGIYDIIISTSVIEHVKDDEEFVKDISYLLKKGGYGILTCDYKDQYQPGDDIPGVDYRFYTQKDLKERIMKAIPECILIDMPQWDCEKPDFVFLDKYNYTFATLVFQKK